MYLRSGAVLYPVKGTARIEHRRRPGGRGIMHPTFVKLFIEADADDLLAEEEDRRRRAPVPAPPAGHSRDGRLP